MDTRHWQDLVSRARATLNSGKSLAVVGWMTSNHNSQTEKFERGGRVSFYCGVPRELGVKTGLVICTRFVGHSDQSRLSRTVSVYPSTLSNGEIKRLLNECTNFLLPVRKVKEEVVTIQTPQTPAEPEPQVVAQEPKEAEMTVSDGGAQNEGTIIDWAKFANLFIQERNKDGYVSKYTLSEIRRKAGLGDIPNSKLVSMGWVDPVIFEGNTNAGTYKAGEKLLSFVGNPPQPLPGDPLSKAKLLIADEQKVIEEISKTEEILGGLKHKLDQIQRAKELIRKLTEIMG